MATTKKAKQQAILDELNGKGVIKPDATIEAEIEEMPEGPRAYMGLPGTTIIGVGNFPQTIEDPKIQKKVENSRSFRRGHVWLDTRTAEENEALDEAMTGFSRRQLRKLASALGHRNIGRLTKLQLIEVCTRDGVSLL
jgi:hypothetical protein